MKNINKNIFFKALTCPTHGWAIINGLLNTQSTAANDFL